MDDDPWITEMVADYFTENGFEVVTAPAGPAALALADTAHLDVVILDIRMPGMNGLQVFQQLHLRWPELPVIMLSGTDDEELAKQTLLRGAFDYVGKPFTWEHLGRCVDAALITRRSASA